MLLDVSDNFFSGVNNIKRLEELVVGSDLLGFNFIKS